MKVLYIGDADNLACSVINQFGKENDEVYLVATHEFKKHQKPGHPYKYYMSSYHSKLRDEIFDSISPDIVIWAGCNYLKKVWSPYEDNYDYLSQLWYWLEKCDEKGVKRFIYLSTTEVYGPQNEHITENSLLHAESTKGMLALQGEHMVETYQKRGHFLTSILRCGEIYEYRYDTEDCHILKEMMDELKAGGNASEKNPNQFIQPISVQDTVDAVKRCIHTKTDNIYNICSTRGISITALNQVLARQMGADIPEGSVDEAPEYIVSNKKAKVELEWTDFKELDRLLETKKYQFQRIIKKNYQSAIQTKKKVFHLIFCEH